MQSTQLDIIKTGNEIIALNNGASAIEGLDIYGFKDDFFIEDDNGKIIFWAKPGSDPFNEMSEEHISLLGQMLEKDRAEANYREIESQGAEDEAIARQQDIVGKEFEVRPTAEDIQNEMNRLVALKAEVEKEIAKYEQTALPRTAAEYEQIAAVVEQYTDGPIPETLPGIENPLLAERFEGFETRNQFLEALTWEEWETPVQEAAIAWSNASGIDDLNEVMVDVQNTLRDVELAKLNAEMGLNEGEYTAEQQKEVDALISDLKNEINAILKPALDKGYSKEDIYDAVNGDRALIGSLAQVSGELEGLAHSYGWPREMVVDAVGVMVKEEAPSLLESLAPSMKESSPLSQVELNTVMENSRQVLEMSEGIAANALVSVHGSSDTFEIQNARGITVLEVTENQVTHNELSHAHASGMARLLMTEQLYNQYTEAAQIVDRSRLDPELSDQIIANAEKGLLPTQQPTRINPMALNGTFTEYGLQEQANDKTDRSPQTNEFKSAETLLTDRTLTEKEFAVIQSVVDSFATDNTSELADILGTEEMNRDEIQQLFSDLGLNANEYSSDTEIESQDEEEI